MSSADGTVKGVTKIIDNGGDDLRFNLVILSDGYQDAELAIFATDSTSFTNTLKVTPPFDTLWPGINVHRVDVSSTDSGATDPVACGGTGATPKTYFDASFCTNGVARLLALTSATALSVARTQVPKMHMTFVIVNSTKYGGSGGDVAVFSRDAAAPEIGIHEMGHTAFGLADEYESLAGCSSGEVGHDSYAGTEPAEPNVTANTARATLKWASLVDAATALPTTSNADCANCDTQASPVAANVAGAFEGARYFHCGIFRPQFQCRMRVLANPFCAVCSQVIMAKLKPFLPTAVPAVTAMAPASGPTVGGTSVVITGSGFIGATSVGFGVTSATTMTIDSDTQITATAPGGAGIVDVTVIGPGGTSATSAADQFTYV